MKMLDTHVPESNSRFHGIGRCVFGGGSREQVLGWGSAQSEGREVFPGGGAVEQGGRPGGKERTQEPVPGQARVRGDGDHTQEWSPRGLRS